MWPRRWIEVKLYSSMTAALEGSEWSAARTGRSLPPGKTRYPFYRRLDGPQGRSGRTENLVPTGIRSRPVQPIVSCYTDWATRPTHIYIYIWTLRGTAVAQWLRYCATNRKDTDSIPAGFSGFFIGIKSFRSYYGPGVNWASNRNECQEYFLGVKAAGA